MTSLGTSFSISFYFLLREDSNIYDEAIRAFKLHVYPDTPGIECILTDEEWALKNALARVFPGIPQLLCVWHVDKNTLGK